MFYSITVKITKASLNGQKVEKDFLLVLKQNAQLLLRPCDIFYTDVTAVLH